MAEPYIAEVAALIGDPARANILTTLLDGRAYTATELAEVAGVTPQTTSGHLAKLSEGRLLEVVPQGRYRYYRLASPAVATALEALAAVSIDGAPRHRPKSSCAAALRDARTCYDHLAGRVAVEIAEALQQAGHLTHHGDHFEVTEGGTVFFRAELGIDLAEVKKLKRGFARSCLDWSERRPHLGGALGAALADAAIRNGWFLRVPRSRALTMTRKGTEALRDLLGIEERRSAAA
jgi:DNA-binding transcriptional ArsR family regulator